MHTLAETAHAPQATDSTIDFMAPGPSEDELAVQASREHDSSQRFIVSGNLSYAGNDCGKCGLFEEAEYDNSYDGSSVVAGLSSRLQYCSEVDCDCAIHPKCAATVDEKTGLCPHCARMIIDQRSRRDQEDDLLQSTFVNSLQDLQRGLKMLEKEQNVRKRAAVQDLLKEIWEGALIGSLSNRDEIERMVREAAA